MDTVVMCFVNKSLIKFSFLKNKCEFIVLGMLVNVCVCVSGNKEGGHIDQKELMIWLK